MLAVALAVVAFGLIGLVILLCIELTNPDLLESAAAGLAGYC